MIQFDLFGIICKLGLSASLISWSFCSIRLTSAQLLLFVFVCMTPCSNIVFCQEARAESTYWVAIVNPALFMLMTFQRHVLSTMASAFVVVQASAFLLHISYEESHTGRIYPDIVASVLSYFWYTAGIITRSQSCHKIDHYWCITTPEPDSMSNARPTSPIQKLKKKVADAASAVMPSSWSKKNDSPTQVHHISNSLCHPIDT